MRISHYFKEKGSRNNGARLLSRKQAVDLPGLLLDCMVTDLKVGAFSPAMRIKSELAFVSTETLSPTSKRLLNVRRAVGLRNTANSLVKLMNLCERKSLVVSSNTHPEYAMSTAQTFEPTSACALLLRGNEGELVADGRKMPQMDGFIINQRQLFQEAQAGTQNASLELPKTTDAASTAAHIKSVLAKDQAVLAPIASQAERILHLV